MGEVRQSLSAGQVYVEPVLVDADTAALEWKAVFDWDKDRLALRDLVMNQGDFMRIAGSLSWDSGAVTANVDALNLRFPRAFSTWVQPWLLESGLDELETEGDVQVALRYGPQGLEALRMQFQNVYVEDAQGRFALYNLDGNLAWDLRERTQSRLQWKSGRIFALDLGNARLHAHSQHGRFELTEALRLPVLDGVLTLEGLRIMDLRDPARMQADLSGYLSPISLQALSQALGWPKMHGKLSGMLPGLQYERGHVRSDGILLARVFDGSIRIRNFRLEDPFSQVPRLTADMEVEGLDLKPLTQTFSFGTIEGTLDGEIHGLELLAWEANRFDVRLRSRVNDDRPHRISRKAVSDLTRVAGGGGGLLQAAGLLSFFDRFAYDSLGWRCKLRNGVCHMGGVSDREGKPGYYIVRGAWLPRVDVVGHARRVDWHAMLQRIATIRIEDVKIQ